MNDFILERFNSDIPSSTAGTVRPKVDKDAISVGIEIHEDFMRGDSSRVEFTEVISKYDFSGKSFDPDIHQEVADHLKRVSDGELYVNHGHIIHGSTTLTMRDVNPRMNADTQCRGAFSLYTLKYLCDHPDQCDGDEYVITHQGLFKLQELLKCRISYERLKYHPRVIIKDNNNAQVSTVSPMENH